MRRLERAVIEMVKKRNEIAGRQTFSAAGRPAWPRLYRGNPGIRQGVGGVQRGGATPTGRGAVDDLWPEGRSNLSADLRETDV